MLKKTLLAGCSKTLRYKASEIPGSETYRQYVAMTRDEGNAVDGRFSATCEKEDPQQGTTL
jgi:hypothetical protein